MEQEPRIKNTQILNDNKELNNLLYGMIIEIMQILVIPDNESSSAFEIEKHGLNEIEFAMLMVKYARFDIEALRRQLKEALAKNEDLNNLVDKLTEQINGGRNSDSDFPDTAS